MKTIILEKEDEQKIIAWFKDVADSMNSSELDSLGDIMSLFKMRAEYNKILDHLQTNIQKIRFKEAMLVDMSENQIDKLFI